MSTRPLLVDSVTQTQEERDRDYDALLRKAQRLAEDLDLARAKADEYRAASTKMARAQARIRQQLSPLFHALKELFGELGSDGQEEDVPAVPRSHDPRWEKWITDLGGKQGEFIRALLHHGAMTREQLKISTHSGSSTVDFVLRKLKELSLITKDGNGKYALKQL